jgi:hypothetical protein
MIKTYLSVDPDLGLINQEVHSYLYDFTEEIRKYDTELTESFLPSLEKFVRQRFHTRLCIISERCREDSSEDKVQWWDYDYSNQELTDHVTNLNHQQEVCRWTCDL